MGLLLDFKGFVENLKPEENKRLEQFVYQNGYIPKREKDLLASKLVEAVGHQIDLYYSHDQYLCENGFPFDNLFTSLDGTKIACMHITYRKFIPLLIDLDPQLDEKDSQEISRYVQENTFFNISEAGEKRHVASEVYINGEEHIFTFKEL